MRGKDRLVDGLQQARAKLPMQPNGRIEHVASDPIYVHHPESLRLCVSARTHCPGLLVSLA
jgi:hypothetical protein